MSMSATARDEEPGRSEPLVPGPVQALVRLLAENLKTEYRDLEPLGQGQGAQIFALHIQNQDMVLRLSENPRHIGSEKQAWMLFHAQLPVPKVNLEGRWQAYHWALIERCQGRSLDDEPPERWLELTPLILELHRRLLLQAIPQDVPALRTGWQHYLFGEALPAQPPHDPHGWLDQAPLKALAAALKQSLADYPMHALWFCHGDFKPSNICADSDRVTGLIDWSELNTTDYLYDPACWLLQQSAEHWPHWREAYYRLHQAMGLDTGQWDLRLRACMLRKVLTTLQHAAASGWQQEFDLAQTQARHLLAEANQI